MVIVLEMAICCRMKENSVSQASHVDMPFHRFRLKLKNSIGNRRMKILINMAFEASQASFSLRNPK